MPSQTACTDLTNEVAAGHGQAFRVGLGQVIEIVALEGPQVADTWAFSLPVLGEVLSTEHTRSCLDKLSPGVGEAFYPTGGAPC